MMPMTHDDWVLEYLSSDAAARNGDSIHGYSRPHFEAWKARQLKRGGYDPNYEERSAPGARMPAARRSGAAYCRICKGPHVHKHGRP